VTTHIHNSNEGGALPSEVTAAAPPAFEEEAIMAIEDCISQGPSVESLARLDVNLRSLDQQLEGAIQQQADGDELAHLIGVRLRVGTLRSQMEALQGVVAYIVYNPQDESLGRQLVQVASDAFAVGDRRRAEAVPVPA